jgi:hypothetical protein
MPRDVNVRARARCESAFMPRDEQESAKETRDAGSASGALRLPFELCEGAQQHSGPLCATRALVSLPRLRPYYYIVCGFYSLKMMSRLQRGDSNPFAVHQSLLFCRTCVSARALPGPASFILASSCLMPSRHASFVSDKRHG